MRVERGDGWAVAHTDCRVFTWPTLFDACVCDPPYELGFMGKAWDKSGVAFDPAAWRAVLDALKPGAHLLAFGGTRTYHRMVCAIEDAGFEIRDQLAWMYGTGFPKSLNGPWGGTALKPAQEPIVMARKPLIGTVAANVLAYGTGGINVDACRIGDEGGTRGSDYAKTGLFGVGGKCQIEQLNAGRWPANVLLDEDAAAMLDEQSGIAKAKPARTGRRGGSNPAHMSRDAGKNEHQESDGHWPGDEGGGASRFFYVAKTSRAERESGCEALPLRSGGELTDREDGSDGLNSPRAGAGRRGGRRNFHATVKPIDLMRYLVRLITPAGGSVLDPFAGTGTTGLACIAERRPFVGCELDDDNFPLLCERSRKAQVQVDLFAGVST